MAEYGITIQSLKKAEPLIKSGQSAIIEFRNENWEWDMVEALVSYEPIEGGVQVEVVTEGGPLSTFEKPVYVKVLQKLEDESVIKKYDTSRLTTDD